MAERVVSGPLWIEGPFVGEGQNVVIDANGRGHAAFVVADQVEVVLRGYVFTGGHGELGGGLRVDGWSKVLVEDCTFEGNRATEGGANGAGVCAGTVKFERCTFGPDDDLLLTGACEVELVDCVVNSGVRIREGATVKFTRGRVLGRIDVAGTTTRAPIVRIDGTDTAGGVRNDEQLPGAVSVATPERR